MEQKSKVRTRMEVPKISVIIPVYNREKVIEPCLRSLFEQTMWNLEFVFVDDGSQDSSIEVVESIVAEYPHRELQVRIIRMPENRGVAVARRIGIENATGEFVIHCDSDDWIDPDMYELLYKKAVEEQADIVGCDIRNEYVGHYSDLHQNYAETVEENIKNLLNGTIFPSLCTSLTRRALIVENGITFPEGLNIAEDLLFNFQLYLHAKKITGISKPCYHYTHTSVSASEQKHSSKSVYSCAEVGRRIDALATEAGYSKKLAKEIAFRKFTLKYNLIRHYKAGEDYENWLSIAPDTHKYIWQFTQYDRKQRLMLWLAAHRLLPLASAFNSFLQWQNKVRHP